MDAQLTGTRPVPRAIFRLLTLRVSEGVALAGSAASIILLSVLSLVLWAGLDWLRYAPDADFYPYGVSELAWFVLAALLTAVVMAKRSRPTIETSRVYVLVALVTPLLIAAGFAIERYLPERWTGLALLALSLYAILYCATGLRSMTGSRQPVALFMGTLTAFIFLGVGGLLYVNGALWVPRETYEAGESESAWESSETLLFSQSARIDAAVENIVRPPGDAAVGFFVGFAGDGAQRVFAEEIKFASRIFADRYDTSARTVLLINDRRSLDEQPLASVSGLQYALKQVASKMDLERDVLFLVLSSHGSDDPLLSVSNGALPLQDLTGDSLVTALNESRIKWRVIVISACHAGAFIEPLQNPYTILITAAAPDRTSFGCSDERDLTYFGEAFFRDSVPKAASLRDAFNTADALVTEREKQEGVEPSYPRAFFGEELEMRLIETMERSTDRITRLTP